MRLLLVLTACTFLTTVAAGQDMPLTQVLLDDQPWQLVSEGYGFTEGPATDAQGNVFFVDVPASKIFKIAVDGTVSLFAENTGKASGLSFGPGGKLYACGGSPPEVAWYGPDAKRTVLVEGIPGNDLVVDRLGGVYVTDMGGKKVWYVSADGTKRVVTEGFPPNGLTLWADGGTLVVADWDNPALRTFRVERDRGLTFGAPYYSPLQQPFNQPKPGSDGMTVDDDGRLYVCTHAGLQMFDPTGRLGGAIAKPQNKFLSNVKFGGPEFDTLFVTSTDKVYKRKVKVRGTPFFLGPPAPKK